MSAIVNDGNQTRIKPSTDVVASMVETFKSELLSVINASQGLVVIDLEGVDVVDSVGIGVIIAAHNTLSQAARELKVINVAQDIFGLFTTMGLDRRFAVEGPG